MIAGRPSTRSRNEPPPRRTPCIRSGVAFAAVVLSLSLAVPGLAAQRVRAPVPAHPAEVRPGSTVVAVLGDGYAEALTEGLQLDAAGQPDTTVLQETHAPSGLADGSGFDWVKAAGDLLKREHVDVAVVMLGANDRSPLADGAGVAEPLGPRWRLLYAQRVQALAEVFQRSGVPLIWVGLPIVADEAMSADFVALNELARDRAIAAGGTYVDTWNAFSDEGGRYSAFGPDAKGRITRLRTGDGLDLTRAGAVKLASFVEQELRARRTPAPPAAASSDVVLSHQPDFDEAASIDVTAQIRREAGVSDLPGAATDRAERGPVVSLNTPALAEGGRLVAPTVEPAPLIGTGGTLAERALVEGLPIQPKPGRADDFSWPRP